MSNKMQCTIITFEKVYEMVQGIAEKVIASNYEPTTIVGLARGGWIPARLMCDFLGITDLISLKVEHWIETGRTKDEAIVRYPLTTSLTKKKILIVDDITDTGQSLLTAIEHLRQLNPEEIRNGVMQYILTSKCTPNYYSEEVRDWYWFIYPWNWIEDTSTLIVRIMSDEAKKTWSLETINSGLQEYFGIRWDETKLAYILQEMNRREQVEKLKSGKDENYKLKRKSVIQL